MDKSSLCLVFGGPSAERAISLNSVRSLYDHLRRLPEVSLTLVYVSTQLKFSVISTRWLYCNTIEDFEFKLSDDNCWDKKTFLAYLYACRALVWPVIHGSFGEDGTLTSWLEDEGIDFIGSPSKTAMKVFRKSCGLNFLKHDNLVPGPYLYLEDASCSSQISEFIQSHKKIVCKPDDGGSSLGVFAADSFEMFQEKFAYFKQYYRSGLLLEKFCEGVEFSIVVVEHQGHPLALVPCSIHLQTGQIFDFRKKYLATRDSSISCPARFENKIIEQIRQKACAIFHRLGARDLLRLDGWVFDSGKIAFSDFNLISGMEQNSILFLQAASCQISHQALCQSILNNHLSEKSPSRKKVFILMGGTNAERQVSLMSGTNVWLKLKNHSSYSVELFFVRHNGRIVKIQEDLALYHTCEEIEEKIVEYTQQNVSWKIDIPEGLKDLCTSSIFELTPEQFCQKAIDSQAFVFLALHGGEGEDGTWQSRLEKYQLAFNGSTSQASKIAMNKVTTGEIISKLQLNHLISLEKVSFSLSQIKKSYLENISPNSLSEDFERFFSKYSQIIIKPLADGCSAGVCVLSNFQELLVYCQYALEKKAYIPAKTFMMQSAPIDLPFTQDFILEPYISTLSIIQAEQLKDFPQGGWIEMTYGILEMNDRFHVLCGSQTVTHKNILTLEEKFQGGTGTNITPCALLTNEDREHINKQLVEAAVALKISNYARFDIFYHLKTKQIIFIEANTLPALTPSTVLFHQSLDMGIEPLQLLESIIYQAEKKNLSNNEEKVLLKER